MFRRTGVNIRDRALGVAMCLMVALSQPRRLYRPVPRRLSYGTDDDVASGLSEAVRVLRPGGRLLVAGRPSRLATFNLTEHQAPGRGSRRHGIHRSGVHR
jgi:hypothetical protein